MVAIVDRFRKARARRYLLAALRKMDSSPVVRISDIQRVSHDLHAFISLADLSQKNIHQNFVTITLVVQDLEKKFGMIAQDQENHPSQITHSIIGLTPQTVVDLALTKNIVVMFSKFAEAMEKKIQNKIITEQTQQAAGIGEVIGNLDQVIAMQGSPQTASQQTQPIRGPIIQPQAGSAVPALRNRGNTTRFDNIYTHIGGGVIAGVVIWGAIEVVTLLITSALSSFTDHDFFNLVQGDYTAAAAAVCFSRPTRSLLKASVGRSKIIETLTSIPTNSFSALAPARSLGLSLGLIAATTIGWHYHKHPAATPTPTVPTSVTTSATTDPSAKYHTGDVVEVQRPGAEYFTVVKGSLVKKPLPVGTTIRLNYIGEGTLQGDAGTELGIISFFPQDVKEASPLAPVGKATTPGKLTPG